MMRGGGSPLSGGGSETGRRISPIPEAAACTASAGMPESRGTSGNAGDEDVACDRHCARWVSFAGSCVSPAPVSWQGACAVAAAGCAALAAQACASAVLWHSSVKTAVMPTTTRLAAFESVMGSMLSAGRGVRKPRMGLICARSIPRAARRRQKGRKAHISSSFSRCTLPEGPFGSSPTSRITFGALYFPSSRRENSDSSSTVQLAPGFNTTHAMISWP